MTRDEIKVVVFILLALLTGAAVKHYREREPAATKVIPTPAPGGWAKPPYVFKNPKERSDSAP